MTDEIKLYSHLNDKQREAVLHTKGPILILAGAGAGKTKTLTERILHLIKQGAEPSSVLAITFTNKAAKEMRERVENLIEKDQALNNPISFQEHPFISTFHSLGVHIIKENARYLGLTRHFSIFDRNDSKRAVKEAVEASNLDPKQWDPAKILSAISKEKGNGRSVREYEEESGNNYFPKIVANVWSKYEAILLREKALDFDDLLVKTVFLLKQYPDVLAHYQQIWKYIHIDEYQDTNKVQYQISKMLAAKERNVCVVGDIDQMIYSWRGADLSNILHFERDYPEAKIVLLEENYRSTQTILDAANTIIKKNKNRREKNLFTQSEAGEKISLYAGYDEAEEAEFVADKARELIQSGTPADEIAVLYRANFQSRILEEAFLGKSVPYQVLGTRFFDRKEVKDVLSYVRAALNPESMNDLKRVINVPARGIGKVTLLKILGGQEDKLTGAVRQKIASFRTLLEKIAEHAQTRKPSETMKFIIKESGLEQSFKEGTEEDEERLENLKELVTLSTKYDGLEPGEGIEKLLEDAALATDQDELIKNTKGVKLMTVHASKGLEFDYVFVTGLEQDLFPHRRMSSDDKTDEEEERRLFYVALTRARKKLFLTFAGIRTIFGSRQVNVPSEFIIDIDENLIQAEERQGYGKTIYFD